MVQVNGVYLDIICNTCMQRVEKEDEIFERGAHCHLLLHPNVFVERENVWYIIQ